MRPWLARQAHILVVILAIQCYRRRFLPQPIRVWAFRVLDKEARVIAQRILAQMQRDLAEARRSCPDPYCPEHGTFSAAAVTLVEGPVTLQ